MLTRLTDSEIIDISGADALAFAQAQFSSDLSQLATGHWQWSAWLSAQGRVRAFFQLLRLADEQFRILLRGGSARHFRDALARYVFRSKVSISTVNDARILVAEDEKDVATIITPATGTRISTSEDGFCIAMPGTTPRWLLLVNESCHVAEDDSPYIRNRQALLDIDSGIATIGEVLEDKLLPTWIDLGDLGATSVRKGCYPGQEVVARLHFKGGNKRWLHRIEFSADNLPSPGASLPAEGENAALVICSAWASETLGRALVVARNDIEAASLSNLAEGVVVNLITRATAATMQM